MNMLHIVILINDFIGVCFSLSRRWVLMVQLLHKQTSFFVAFHFSPCSFNTGLIQRPVMICGYFLSALIQFALFQLLLIFKNFTKRLVHFQSNSSDLNGEKTVSFRDEKKQKRAEQKMFEIDTNRSLDKLHEDVFSTLPFCWLQSFFSKMEKNIGEEMIQCVSFYLIYGWN